MSHIKKLSISKKILLITSIFLLLLFFLTPINGDDWGNYLVGKKGLLAGLKNAAEMYYSWEGRFISRLLIDILTYHKWLWNILNTTIVISFITICHKFITQKNKIYYLIPIFLLFTCSNYFYTQCYLWVAGNITYLIPSILTIIVVYYLYKNIKNNLSILESIVLIVLSIIIPMFVENIGCAYVVAILLMNIYYYLENKKISFIQIIMLLLSIISLIIMLKSPGSASRMQIYPEFENMSLSGKIFYNIPNFISYTFGKNAIILLFVLILINKMLISKLKNIKYKNIILIIFNIIPTLSILENILYIMPLNININYSILNTSNWYYLLYWFIFTLLWFYTIIYFIKDKKEKIFFIILLLVGFISTGVMLLTPVWGERVTALYILINILIITRISNNVLVFKGTLRNLFLTLVIISYIAIITCGIINRVFDIRRENTINKQINSDTIIVPVNKLQTLWNYNPWDEYHISSFKNYYNIDSSKELTLKILSAEEYIKYLIRGEY